MYINEYKCSWMLQMCHIWIRIYFDCSRKCKHVGQNHCQIVGYYLVKDI